MFLSLTKKYRQQTQIRQIRHLMSLLIISFMKLLLIELRLKFLVASNLMELNRLSVQSTHNDSVVVNENTNYLQINELNKELDSLRNELKSKNEIISTLMKETCVERDVVISKNIKMY